MQKVTIADLVFVAEIRSNRSFLVISRQAAERMGSDGQLNETENRSDRDRRLDSLSQYIAS